MVSSARHAAISIWNAGVNAVRAEQLIGRSVVAERDQLSVDGVNYSLRDVRRICIVGAGKAAGYLAAALERTLSNAGVEVYGWVNVPANCVVPSDRITLHAARPAEVNEPRAEGVRGTQEILRLVSELDEHDLCICVLTGGGSALLPAPAPGISLQDKTAVTRLLSENGATIQELNRIRTSLSSIKGGGLARACRSGRLVTLIISDVLGDPLDVIASGPTFVNANQADEAPDDILSRYASLTQVPGRVWDVLRQYRGAATPSCRITHHVLANNSTAVEAAAREARGRGLGVLVIPPESPKTHVESVAQVLAERISKLERPGCILWGGEPIINLVQSRDRGLGGRNQHLVLELFRLLSESYNEFPTELCILSGGTDGEDGPTDAAGSFVDAEVSVAIRQQQLTPESFLKRNDAYSFFQKVGGLMQTGPTHTNVCDLRVIVYE